MKNTATFFLPSSEDHIMVVAALGYCLGRRSYIVSICCNWLQKIWNNLDFFTQSLLLRDIAEALINKESLLEEDWVRIGKWMIDKMSQEQIEEVNRMISWKGVSDVVSFFNQHGEDCKV